MSVTDRHPTPQSQTCTYLYDTYLDHIDTRICAVGTHEGSAWAAVEECIFHPQGGGQPADRGWIDDTPIVPVRDRATGLILARGQYSTSSFRIGQYVNTRIDRTTRLENSAHHTAGHLVEAAGRLQGWALAANNHFPGQARIDFVANDDVRLTSEVGRREITAALRTTVREAIAARLVVTSRIDPDGNRTVDIADIHSAPCGGTHVRTLGELAEVAIPTIRVKRGRIRVSYSASYAPAGTPSTTSAQ